jgi:hypothetical protein
MITSNIRNIVLVAAVAAFTPLFSGCYADVEPEAVYTEGGGYRPMYYDGYVVYFDGGGRPYYYNGGAYTWVPRESPYYGAYVTHYNTYGRTYRTWYTRGGYRYRSYRSHPGRWR